MNFNKLGRLATVSAIALGFSVSAGQVWAAAYELDSGVVLPVNVGADVLETVDVVVTDAAIGNIGVHQDKTGADTATLVMAPDGTITEDVAGPARIVHETGTGTAAQVVLTAAFPTTDIYATYSNPVDLNCALCALSPDFTLVDVLDDMDNPNGGAGPGTGVAAGTLAGDGQATTDANGALTWNIGVTIETIASANYYETGAYAGSFDMILSY